MTLQASGAISLADVQTEYGGANPISLSEYYGVPGGLPTSGTISLSNFYGKSNYTAMWSGNSTFVAPNNGYTYGIVVSGSSWAAYYSAVGQGAWATANGDGTFSCTGDFTYVTAGFSSGGYSMSGNAIRGQITTTAGANSGAWLYFSVTTKWATGTSLPPNLWGWGLEASSGLLRACNNPTINAAGPWISLT